MRQPFAVLLFVVAGALGSPPAHGAASASITVNGTTRTLSETGFIFEQVGVSAPQLQPGESRDYLFNYSFSVQDSGLPVAFDQAAIGCTSLHVSTCQEAYTGFEYAKAYLLVFYDDPRTSQNPTVIEEGLNGSATLATHGDSFAESLTQSGTLEAHVLNSDVPGANPYSHLYPTYVALWVLANPIPEPTVLSLMLAGLLVVVGVAHRPRVRRARGCHRPSHAPCIEPC